MCLGEYRKSASPDPFLQSVEVGIVCLHLVSFAKLGRREDGILSQDQVQFPAGKLILRQGRFSFLQWVSMFPHACLPPSCMPLAFLACSDLASGLFLQTGT